jgi:hypothetical protein
MLPDHDLWDLAGIHSDGSDRLGLRRVDVSEEK